MIVICSLYGLLVVACIRWCKFLGLFYNVLGFQLTLVCLHISPVVLANIIVSSATHAYVKLLITSVIISVSWCLRGGFLNKVQVVLSLAQAVAHLWCLVWPQRVLQAVVCLNALVSTGFWFAISVACVSVPSFTFHRIDQHARQGLYSVSAAFQCMQLAEKSHGNVFRAWRDLGREICYHGLLQLLCAASLLQCRWPRDINSEFFRQGFADLRYAVLLWLFVLHLLWLSPLSLWAPSSQPQDRPSSSEKERAAAGEAARGQSRYLESAAGVVDVARLHTHVARAERAGNPYPAVPPLVYTGTLVLLLLISL